MLHRSFSCPIICTDTIQHAILFIITSFYGHLPRYYYQIVFIVSQIVVVLVNRELSDGSVNWPHVIFGDNY